MWCMRGVSVRVCGVRDGCEACQCGCECEDVWCEDVRCEMCEVRDVSQVCMRGVRVCGVRHVSMVYEGCECEGVWCEELCHETIFGLFDHQPMLV